MGTVEALKPEPPTEASSSRDAIGAVMDNVTGKLCTEIESVRRMLDELSRVQVQRAGGIKRQLMDFVESTERLRGEVRHLDEVTQDLRAEHARLVGGEP